MQPDLNRVIEQVSKEKGMDRSVIIEALESAMLSAARRTFGQKRIEAKFNPDIGEIELFEIKTVVEAVTDPETEVDIATARETLDPEAQIGDELLSKLRRDAFGRIAAQVAKQSVIQKVREAERELIYNEFKNRKGDVFSGIVQRVEKKNIIVNLGRTDAVLPEKEQIPWERYRQGDRIRAYILDVEMSHKGPQIRSCGGNALTLSPGPQTRRSTCVAPCCRLRCRRLSSMRKSTQWRSSSLTINSLWPLARKGRTSDSPRASQVGSSTSVPSPRWRLNGHGH